MLSQAELALLLRPTPYRPKKQEAWRPPLDWKFVVSRMRPELREAYARRCEEWYGARPKVAVAEAAPQVINKINSEIFQAAFRKYGAIIPIPELIRAGCTKEQIKKIVAKRKWYKDHDEELQKEIEKKWPGGKVKSKKVIKAVNKRLPGGIENV